MDFLIPVFHRLQILIFILSYGLFESHDSTPNTCAEYEILSTGVPGFSILEVGFRNKCGCLRGRNPVV